MPQLLLRLFVCACILALSHWYSVVAEYSDSQLVVHTPSGDIRGRIEPVVYGLSVRQFRGIPFAEPPIGKLRFAKPQPAQPWTGIRDATDFGPMCTQLTDKEFLMTLNKTLDGREEGKQSEDCLYLNVYTPKLTKPGDNNAVMVWIHGGGNTFGAGHHYDPSVIVALHDVIVVTINYRLGVFGFFNIPGTDTKGNYAMHDQVLALQWVQQHISSFGGNPDSVTIFGESAGGMSVSLHLLSPLSKGLFHRAISQSGSSAASAFVSKKPKSMEIVEFFANSTGCPPGDNTMDCLRSKSTQEIYKAQVGLAYSQHRKNTALAGPIIDGDFMPDDTRKLLREGRVNTADVIVGINAKEGALFELVTRPFRQGGLKEFIQGREFALSVYQNDVVDAAIIQAYTDHRDPENLNTQRQQLQELFTDILFAGPVVYEVQALAAHARPPYFYVFEHVLDFYKSEDFTSPFRDSAHGLDLPFTMGTPLYPGHSGYFVRYIAPRYSDREIGLSLSLMNIWTDFAKYGDPNHSGNLPVTWPRYNSTTQPHLVISLKPRVEYKFHADKMAFWNEFIPKLGEVEPKREEQKDGSTASKQEL